MFSLHARMHAALLALTEVAPLYVCRHADLVNEVWEPPLHAVCVGSFIGVQEPILKILLPLFRPVLIKRARHSLGIDIPPSYQIKEASAEKADMQNAGEWADKFFTAVLKNFGVSLL